MLLTENSNLMLCTEDGNVMIWTSDDRGCYLLKISVQASAGLSTEDRVMLATEVNNVMLSTEDNRVMLSIEVIGFVLPIQKLDKFI